MQFRLTGEVPAKKNSRIFNVRTHRSFPSKAYAQWHEKAYIEILQTKNKIGLAKPIDVPCKLDVLFVHDSYRRRDCDNGLSSILDLLVDTGILQDDNWKIVREVAIKNEYKKNGACCLISVEELI